MAWIMHGAAFIAKGFLKLGPEMLQMDVKNEWLVGYSPAEVEWFVVVV